MQKKTTIAAAEEITLSRTALAFMSYVNEDDNYANGKITQFREYLSRAVKAHSGKPFEIFQDKKDIKWGQPWQERINDALDATLFLIPIITPSFFNSSACREELERFLKREKELGRGDLILLVYYFDCPVLNDKEKRKQDSLAESIAARQREDWRELRHHSFKTRKLSKALEKMAQLIMAALERSEAEVSRVKTEKDNSTSASGNAFSNTGDGTQSIAQGPNPIGTQINNYYTAPPKESRPQPAPAAKIEPPTVIVDQHNQGDYTNITEALKAVEPGTRILVRPGLYKEGIVVNKPVEIIGDGKRDDIVIQASGNDAVLFQADNGRIANLTLRQDSSRLRSCFNIAQGRLELEDCDISSQGAACIAIHSGANPCLRRNRIHDGKGAGIFVKMNGQGIIEDNVIFANAGAGVEIKMNDKSILRRNRIFENSGPGIWIEFGGGGIFEDNDLRGNFEAWRIGPFCEARVQRRGNKE